MRLAAKRDRNHGEIVRALRAAGCSVADCASMGGGFPDLVVAIRGRNILMEIKDGELPPSARALTPAQVAFHGSWRGEIAVVCSKQEAIDAVFKDVSDLRR